MSSPPLGYNSFDPAQGPVESATKRGGGPETPTGKAASRRNALKHGLTASALLPDVQQPGRFEQCQQEFQRDYPPSSTIERILLADIARHSAALAEGAVLRQGALSVGQLMLATVQEPAAREDVSLAAAVSTEGLDRFARYRRGHERALFAAITILQELRGTKRSGAAEDVGAPVLERTLVARTVHTACRRLVLDCLRATVAEML